MSSTDGNRIERSELKRKSVRGGIVTMVSQAVCIAIQLTSVVVLARLLSAEDYGVVAMVMTVISFAGLFRDLGLSSAVIQKKDLTDRLQSNLFWLNVALGGALTLIVAAASPLVAWFYKNPDLTTVSLTLSSSFLIVSLGTQHGARLVRDMHFIRQAVASVAGSLISLLVSISFALQGYSYWALVWGMLLGSLTTTVLLFLLSPFWPSCPAKDGEVRKMLTFGANVTAFDFINYFHRNLDSVLIGKYCSPEILGYYSRAYQLMMFPINAIRGPINAVAFPALSRLQDEPNAYRAYYRRITFLVAFTSMPICAFLFVTSDPLISLLLGPQWLPASPIFSMLAITGFIQPTASLRGLVMLSRKRGKAYLLWGALNALSVTLGFLIGIWWGAVGVALGYAVANYTILYPSLLIAFHSTPVMKTDFFLPILRPATAAIAGSMVALLSLEVLTNVSLIPRLTIVATVFFICYLAVFISLPGGWRELRLNAILWRHLMPQREVSGQAGYVSSIAQSR
ncbi:MAG: lipopolysaccharide biosynthesis protein [Novipirellula sp. JB048]